MTGRNAVPYMWLLITECFFHSSLLVFYSRYISRCTWLLYTHAERGCWRSITRHKDFSLLPGDTYNICSSNPVYYAGGKRRIKSGDQPLWGISLYFRSEYLQINPYYSIFYPCLLDQFEINQWLHNKQYSEDTMILIFEREKSEEKSFYWK